MNAPVRQSLLSHPMVCRPQMKAAAATEMSDDRYTVTLAQTGEDLREAQRLRYWVFKEEYGAAFSSPEAGLDADDFDPHCDHLIVRDQRTLEIVGTYRILGPSQAARLGGYYSESEFSLSALDPLRNSLVELGRSCVHPDHRNGAVIMMLWSGISRYMLFHGYEHLMGCASVSMRDGGRNAKAIWSALASRGSTSEKYGVVPMHRLPMEQIEAADTAQEPPLIKGYIRVGAKVCGEPSWDLDFNTADFLMVLRLAEMTPRYARHFGLLGSEA
ncbi:MAG: GNAT family N-acetyltransferase [Proteobacteria bacterium]|nr:GNAT family N-acetyltransferase [Pseudomonadota bacterium]